MNSDRLNCKDCPDYNEIYMKANGELYCACDKCREDIEDEEMSEGEWAYMDHLNPY